MNKKDQTKTAISRQQIVLIHTLRSAMGMDEDIYRAVLIEVFNVDSSKDLSFNEAEALIRQFEKEAISMGVWEHQSRTDKYKALKGREGFATPSQLSLIEGLWKKVSRVDEKHQDNALRAFLMRQAGVSDLRFLKGRDASKVIVALRAMVQQSKRKVRQKV